MYSRQSLTGFTLSLFFTLLASFETYAAPPTVITDSNCDNLPAVSSGDSFVLDTDLVQDSSSEDCFFFNAVSQVKIRLNGHSITNTAVGGGIVGSAGIDIKDSTNIQIIGPGRISGFFWGIRTGDNVPDSSSRISVQEIIADNNSNRGVVFQYTDTGSVENVVAFNNPTGISVINSAHNIDVIGNEMFGNDIGLEINTNAHNNTVERNNISGNSINGVSIGAGAGADNVLADNIILGNSIDIFSTGVPQIIGYNLCDTENVAGGDFCADTINGFTISNFRVDHNL